MPCCGPKLSICFMILSIWGIIQLGLMGVFYFFRAVALSEDLPPTAEYQEGMSLSDFYTKVDAGYTQNAFNCWIAALLYLATLVFSAQQFWANNRSSLSV